jgi:O-methyltransferase involved in polyketide biosynthesis
MIAAYRARETERADALFRDPLAARLAGDRGMRILENLPQRTFLGGWSIVIRTCIIDSFIQSAVAEGIDTIVNLGAGLDTRPISLSWPMRQWWRIIRLIAPAEKLKAMGKFMGYVLFEPVPR